MDNSYDIVLVGSGFSSLFFLKEYLKHAPANSKVLILERGNKKDFSWLNSNHNEIRKSVFQSFINKSSKEWFYTPFAGGGSNCWWACTPRLMPNDFLLHSKYSQGTDWPVTYDEIENYYAEVENEMSISGPDYAGFYPRSSPYPDKPHLFSDFDRAMKENFPGQYFEQPTARARSANKFRTACCANGICHKCPVNAKFTILNSMNYLLEDPRVKLITESNVLQLEIQNNICSGVHYKDSSGKTLLARSDFTALGANAIFNPYIMLRSGINNSNIGKGLNEQVSVDVIINLKNLKNFNGSTSITGHGFMFYDGSHRKDKAACLVESYNSPISLRTEKDKWQNRAMLKFIFEDLRQDKNHVKISSENPEMPETIYTGHSSYTQASIDSIHELVNVILAKIEADSFEIKGLNKTENHIMGTTLAGRSRDDSVVDKYMRSHDIKNLAVLGSGAFPTSPPANPTLTLCALALMSANKIFGKK